MVSIEINWGKKQPTTDAQISFLTSYLGEPMTYRKTYQESIWLPFASRSFQPRASDYHDISLAISSSNIGATVPQFLIMQTVGRKQREPFVNRLRQKLYC